jgi:hypothetical protein
MPQQLTRADIADMLPADVEKARKAGQLDELLGRPTENADTSEAQDPNGEGKAKPDRRKQLPRSAMLDLDPDQFEEKLKSGAFDAVLEGATHVLDCATGNVHDVTGTNEDDLSPIVKAEDAAGEEREDLAEKLFENWVPLTGDIFVKAAEAMADAHVKATKHKLPLKPAQQDAIKAGELVVVDQDNGSAVLCQVPTEKEKKEAGKESQADADRKDEGRRNGAAGVLSTSGMAGGK